MSARLARTKNSRSALVEEPVRRIGTSRYLRVADGTTWPMPDLDDFGSVAWKLTYAPQALTREDYLYATSILKAYGHLVTEASREKQGLVARSIRRFLNSRAQSINSPRSLEEMATP